MYDYLIKFLVFTFLSELFRPDVKAQRPASAGLKDLSFPTADPTRPLPWLIGKYMVDAPNLFCTYDFRAVERSKKVRNGIFGMSTTELPLPTEYYISAGMTLCGGTGVRLREIWIDDVKVWTGNASSGASVYLDYSVNEGGSADYPAGFRGYVDFHSGATAPNNYLVAKRGAGNTPAFSHLTYVVLRGADAGAWIGTSTQVKPLKFVCERMPTASTTGLGAHPDGGNYFTVGEDANPVYAIAEVMTNGEYCAGIAADELLASSFHAAAKKCYLEGHGTSQLWDNQRSTGEVVLEVCKQIGAVLQSDPATGAHVMKLLRADDLVTYTFDDNNIKELQSFGRNAMDEATNALTLAYVDKEAGWEKRSHEAQDLAAIEVANYQIITGTGSYAGITNAALCASIAQRDLRAISAPLANARFTAIVEKRLKFRPGDLVNFSSERNGVSSVNMRVTSSRYSKPGEALCEIEAVEDVFTAGEAIYSTPAPIANSPTEPPTFSPSSRFIGIVPSALTSDENNHIIAAYAARDVAQAQVDIGFAESADTSTDALSYVGGVRTYPVCTGARLLNPIKWNQKTGIDIILDEPGMAVLKANLARFSYGVLAVMNVPWPVASISGDNREEYVTVSGVTITGPLTATIALSKRGMFDTYPLGYGTTKGIFFLFGSVVDPMPLKTVTSTEAPAGQRYYYTTLDGAPSATVVARFRNIAGTSQPDSRTVSAFVNSIYPLEPRGLLPASPAKVQCEGVFGAKDSGDTPPALSMVGRTKLNFTWSDRGYGLGTEDWFAAPALSAEAAAASTSRVGYVLEYSYNREDWTRVDGSMAWIPLGPGVQKLEVNAGYPSPLEPGAYVRLRVFTYREVSPPGGGTDYLFNLNFLDDDNGSGQQHSFVWKLDTLPP